MNPHAPALQVATLFMGTGQRVHEGPHPSGEVPSLHTSPQRRKPVLQVKSQLPAEHVATPLGGTGHGVQRDPQVATVVSLTQVSSHA